MKLKQRGTSVPTLEKAQSVIDENVSEHLIAQAFEVMFKEFERYIKIMKNFKGVDWTIYVKMRNKERKNNDSKKEFDDEDLLDEEDVPKEEEKEPAKPEEEEKKEQPVEEEKKEEPSTDPENKEEKPAESSKEESEKK